MQTCRVLFSIMYFPSEREDTVQKPANKTMDDNDNPAKASGKDIKPRSQGSLESSKSILAGSPLQ